MDIGNKIAQARREQGITQIELANRMCVTRQTISRWETGAAFPDIEKVAELAEILQVSCDYLLREHASETNMISSNSENNPPKENAGKSDQAENHNSVTKLLSGILGKKVRITFYDDEEDIDLEDEICVVDSFEGNWIWLTVLPKNEKKQKKLAALSSALSFETVLQKKETTQKKLVSLSSVLSFEIVDKEEI